MTEPEEQLEDEEQHAAQELADIVDSYKKLAEQMTVMQEETQIDHPSE